MAAMHRYVLTDAQWEYIAPFFPPRYEDHRSGPPWRLQRRIVNAILWHLHTWAPWRDLPERYGPWQTGCRAIARVQQGGDGRAEISLTGEVLPSHVDLRPCEPCADADRRAGRAEADAAADLPPIFLRRHYCKVARLTFFQVSGDALADRDAEMHEIPIRHRRGSFLLAKDQLGYRDFERLCEEGERRVSGVVDDDQLADWVGRATRFVRTLPAK